jgi:NhaA family Na+:H+ antiporter
MWYCVLRSGVHPTVAGVIGAFAVPLRAGTGIHGPLRRIEHALDAPVNYLIMPLFALANAGVVLSGGTAVAGGNTLALAIAAALVLGKQAGVALSVFACEVLGVARRPAETNALHIWGAALACGVGFTMSLFITTLAFPDAPELAERARLGIIGGSAIAGLTAGVVLWFAHRRAYS